MNEDFDIEAVLREVLEVLRKHNLPIETVSLNVSLLDAAFGRQFPRLKTYEAAILRQSMVIEQVAMLFEAQRRYPFDEIVPRLEHELRPPVEAFAENLRQDYPDLDTKFTVQMPSKYPKYYRLAVDCLYWGVDSDYDNLELEIALTQSTVTEYPRLSGWVGWRISEHGENEGYDHTEFRDQAWVNDEFAYAPYHVRALGAALPRFFECVRKELGRKQSGELDTPA